MAAEPLVRLKFDSKEYDSKIERARKGILDFEESLQKAGKSFKDADAEQVKFAQQLGNFQTVARTAKGQVAELTKAYTDLKLQYDKLSEADKSSDFGKGMAASLDTLKTRIQDSKKELADINRELGDTKTESGGAGSALDALTSKFGLSTKQLVGWGAAITAAKAALDVAKDAFFKNEEQLDEWGRTVESCESIYSGFLSSLNNGDISGFLGRIDQIIGAARDAYNALDALGTFNAFNQVNVEKTRTGMTEAIVDYREGNGSKEAVRAAGDAYKKELEERRKLENEAYLEAVKKIASERGVSYQDLLDAMSGSYGHYKDLKNVQPSGSRTQTTFLGPGMAPSVTQVPVAVTQQEKLGEALRQLNDTELKSLQALGAQAQRTGNEIAQVDRQIVRVLNGKQGGGGGGTTPKADTIEAPEGSMAALTKEMQELQKAQQLVTDTASWQAYADEIDKVKAKMEALKGATAGEDIDALFPQLDVSGQQQGTPKTALQEAQDAIRVQISDQNVQVDENTFTNLLQVAVQNGIDSLDADFTSFQEMLGEGLNIPDESWESFVEKLNEQLSDLGIDPIKLDVTTGNIKAITNDTKEMTNAWKSAASAVSSVGGAMKQIDDPAAKIAGIVAEAIASIALGYANATSQASEMGPWVWLAFAAAGLATTITTIAQIKQATSGNYAEGGIVPGSSFSGDNVRAYGLNSGELILNRAQQGSIAEQLTAGDAASGGDPIVRVSGEDLIIVMNTALRRRGYGNLAIGDFN